MELMLQANGLGYLRDVGLSMLPITTEARESDMESSWNIAKLVCVSVYRK